jgi:hypothetical protein
MKRTNQFTAKARKGFLLFDTIIGHFDKLISVLLEKYGYTQRQAEEQ